MNRFHNDGENERNPRREGLLTSTGIFIVFILSSRRWSKDSPEYRVGLTQFTTFLLSLTMLISFITFQSRLGMDKPCSSSRYRFLHADTAHFRYALAR